MQTGEMVPRTERSLTIGEGSIEPEPRLTSGEINEDQLYNFENDLLGAKYFEQLPENVTVPNMCVDGRLSQRLGPNSAGGTFSLVVADALTTGSYRQPGERSPDHARRLYKALVDDGYEIGGHDDNLARGSDCGCGAEDNFDSASPNRPSILQYLGTHAKEIKNFIESLGIEVGDGLTLRLQKQSENLQNEVYYPNLGGIELRQAFTDVAGEAAVETLPGTHNEVAVVVNTQEGTTLDRQSLAEEYGDEYQAFNVDVWALEKAAHLISSTPEEAYEKYVASLFYNVAVAGVLAGKSLRVLVR